MWLLYYHCNMNPVKPQIRRGWGVLLMMRQVLDSGGNRTEANL